MIKTIDNQLETYDEKVGSSLNTIQCNAQGQISLNDLKKAMVVIKHRPDDETIERVCQKLDVDQDGFVVSTARWNDNLMKLELIVDKPIGPRPRRRAHTGYRSRHRRRRPSKEDPRQGSRDQGR